jgi:virulence factor Mce-like protein
MSGTGRRGGINPLVAGFVAGVLIAFVVGLMATINLQYGAPWAKTHQLTAQVTDADSMSIGSDVRIAGRLVGQVTGIKAAGDHANITFHVDESDWPIPADTTVFVRLATLLGQKYIQLNPGHSSLMMADNATIPLTATKPVVDFDQILNTFDKPTRDALTSLIRTAAAAVQNQEGTIQQLIPNLADLSVHSQVPTAELVTRDPEFNKILINLGITADQLNQSRNDFAGVIDNLNTVTAALSSKEGAALKSYIVNTDALNLTTHAVLAGGYAATLDSGLQQIYTFANYLGGSGSGWRGLLPTLIPETAQSCPPGGSCVWPHGFNGATDGNTQLHGSSTTPAQAGIDLIYEIGGSAVSQGDGSTTNNGITVGNFFLRQFAQGIDVCGLLSGIQPLGHPIPCSSSPPTPPSAPTITIPSLPLPSTCIPALPITCGSTPVQPPCVPVVNICPPDPNLPFNTPSLPVLPTLPPLPTVPPVPTAPVGPCIPFVDPTCPTPAPIGIAYHVTMNDWLQWSGFWPVRYR